MKKGINEIKSLDNNPREISPFMMSKLIESILVFPQMLVLRPLVLNEDNKSLGGNQRLDALRLIAGMSREEIVKSLNNQTKYRDKSDEEKCKILSYWEQWQQKPDVEVRYASSLTEDEQKEFVVKDNLHYGVDDTNLLIHNFDIGLIEDYTGEIIVDRNDNIDFSKSTEPTGDRSSPPDDTVILSCGYIAMKLSANEYTELADMVIAYQTEHGTTDGFVKFLLGL